MRPAHGLGFLALALAGAVSAQEPATLSAGAEPTSLAGHVSVLADESGALTFDDVRSPQRAARFPVSNARTFNYGYSGLAYWYRATLVNPASARVSEWVIELKRPVLDYVDVHVTRPDGTTESFLTGDRRQAPLAQLRQRNFALPLKLEPGAQVTVYVRAQTAGAHAFQMTVWTRAGFDAHTTIENFAYGTFIGCIALMVVYNALIWVWIRDRAYLYYVLWLANMVLLGLSYTGYARAFGNAWSDDAPAWISSSAVYLQLIGQAFSWLFAREFLQLRQHAPRMHALATGMVVLNGALVLLCPVLGFTLSDQLSDLSGVVGIALLLSMAGYLALKGVRAAQFYFVAWTLCFVGVAVEILQMAGALPLVDGSAVWYTFMGGALLGVTLLSLSLADRIELERKEKSAAREHAGRLRSFLPQKVADLVGAGSRALLEPKRREITVCVIDLRGFTPFSETSAPEDVMNVLREFYETMGAIVEKHGGTVEHFAGDSMLIFLNAPLEVEKHEEHAVRAALEMRAAFEPLRTKWIKLGHELGLGIGIADGYATIGAIGFAGRSQYAAIGAVTNLASRLCSSAAHGEILTTGRVLAAVEEMVESESAGEQTIKGFHRPIALVRVKTFRQADVGGSRVV